MKTAFTVWKDRIAPLFDVARLIHVVEFDDGCILCRKTVPLEHDMPAYKIRQLAEMGVQTLVCGAISRPVQSMVSAYGIDLVSFVNGDLQAVIHAWRHDTLRGEVFRMPGCRRRSGRVFQSELFTNQGEKKMNTNTVGRSGKGRGGQCRRGKGGGGQFGKPQNSGGPRAMGSRDMCVCPYCGNQEPHQQGVPCMNQVCAKCGMAMTRQ